MYNDETVSLRATDFDDSFYYPPHHDFDSTTSHAPCSSCNRPPTPPPDMHGMDNSIRTAAYPQYPAYANQPSFQFQEQGRIGTNSQPLSPSSFARSFTNQETTSEPSTSRRPSHANSIAPSFQIPKTVNDSGGSLSELAAQITCLFWFESSELLQQIEQAPQAIFPARSLAKDAIPSTGFRKWVTTILSTTLVGANVVLLALLFIHRLKNLNPAVKGKPGSEYRLLTVALMLGNKFLDDNTYTNKTWAEVSGINVSEVHIMEVEFLSNMKYCLYTSMEQWADWQALLGRYALYVERAMHPIPARAVPAPILPPASSIRLPMALPSPPASIQNSSPPYNTDRTGGPYLAHPIGLTPAPSPLAPYSSHSQEMAASRKRSRDDSVIEPAVKRVHMMHQPVNSVQAQRLPTLPPPVSQLTSVPPAVYTQAQLPPMTVPARAMGLVYPSTAQSTPPVLSAVPDLRAQSLPQSQPGSRQQSPYWRADDGTHLPPTSNLLGPLESSPSAYLQQRSSPYRPIHNVSTLLYPPPSAALQPRQQNIEHSQMHYQPLGKSSQLQSGRLPHITPGSWVDAVAPLRQWQLPAVAPAKQSLPY